MNKKRILIREVNNIKYEIFRNSLFNIHSSIIFNCFYFGNTKTFIFMCLTHKLLCNFKLKFYRILCFYSPKFILKYFILYFNNIFDFKQFLFFDWYFYSLLFQKIICFICNSEFWSKLIYWKNYNTRYFCFLYLWL